MAAALRGKTVSVSGKTVLPPPARVSQPAYWRNDGCLADQMSAVPAQCAFGDTKHPTMTVALVGDSMAGNWWAPLVEIADQEHWKLVTDLHGNCPLGSGRRADNDGWRVSGVRGVGQDGDARSGNDDPSSAGHRQRSPDAGAGLPR
jgi:hypothetical protein